MFKVKYYQVLALFYLIIFCVLIGLIIHKFTTYQKLTASPTVSFNIEVTEKMSPENLVSQIYGWMGLDSQRSTSILVNTLPNMDKSKGGQGIIQQVVEPKNIIEHFVYWVAGINFSKPSTYFISTYPKIDTSVSTVMAPEDPKNLEWKNNEANLEKQYIEGVNSRIQLNIPPDEMLIHQTGIAPVTNLPTRETLIDSPKTEENYASKVQQRKPRILIYHTHTSETYSDDPNPKDSKYHAYLPNVGRITWVGSEVARILTEKGFEVCHDTTSYDGEEFNRAYENVVKGQVSQILSKQHFDLVIDFHRDGSEADIRNNCLAKINGKNAAQVMFVIAVGEIEYVSTERQTGLAPLFEQKLRMAAAFAGKMQEMYPGLTREFKRASGKWYAQQLHPHSMILEVGYQKNNTAEAIYTAQLIANVIYELFTDDPSLLLD